MSAENGEMVVRQIQQDIAKIDEDEGQEKGTIVERQAAVIQKKYHIISFRGRPMIAMGDDFPHFEPLTMEIFKKIGYPELGGQTRSRMGDIFDYLAHTAIDMTDNDHLICFGSLNVSDDIFEEGSQYVPTTVWDMRDLSMMSNYPANETVWRSPYHKWSRGLGTAYEPIPFIMSLAGGSKPLYDDIMQSMAPLVMEKKPDGVIWWVGDGANGKSTLMDALYKMFPGQLTGLTIKQLTDGRDTPRLNGTLGNIVKESSEGRIEDTEVYKSLGTHESFPVHKFHTQEPVTINGNIHHIFSGNSVPVFNDKGFSARRRTHIIPFNMRFVSDPTFEEKTFTPEFFGRLAVELCKYANQIKRQGYRYKFSSVTEDVKTNYDTEANNAEEYARELKVDGVVAFDSFQPVRQDYEQWCAEGGRVPLGVGYMRRAIIAAGFERISFRDSNGVTKKHYRLPNISPVDLTPYGGSRFDMYTVPGFEREVEDEPAVEAPPVPDFKTGSESDKVGSKW